MQQSVYFVYTKKETRTFQRNVIIFSHAFAAANWSQLGLRELINDRFIDHFSGYYFIRFFFFFCYCDAYLANLLSNLAQFLNGSCRIIWDSLFLMNYIVSIWLLHFTFSRNNWKRLLFAQPWHIIIIEFRLCFEMWNDDKYTRLCEHGPRFICFIAKCESSVKSLPNQFEWISGQCIRANVNR